jgi:phosphopantothenoylcysteine decarboxylase/phosphopantothenate--cysteine ligase
MAEPEEIWAYIQRFFAQKEDLKGKKIVITAGPTFEALDPVRFIGNRSSGKMGYAIAESCANRGAEVVLVSGPTNLAPPLSIRIKTIKVESAQQMFEATTQAFETADAAILAAAVADYRPKNVSDIKIKKKENEMFVELEKTPDIAAHLGKMKTEKQRLIGFALETNNELANAIEKKQRKNFDFIVLNSLRDAGAGFNHETNKITLVFDETNIKNFELKSKKDAADDIVEALKNLF